MKKELKLRLLTVAAALEKLGEIDTIHHYYEDINRMLSLLASKLPQDQHDLLIEASQLVTKAQRLTVQQAKKVQGKVLNYVHDPLVLQNHEDAAKSKIEQLGSEDAISLRDRYNTKLKQLIDQQGISPEDMQELLHIFDSKK